MNLVVSQLMLICSLYDGPLVNSFLNFRFFIMARFYHVSCRLVYEIRLVAATANIFGSYAFVVKRDFQKGFRCVVSLFGFYDFM